MAERFQRPGWFTKNVFNRLVAALTRGGHTHWVRKLRASGTRRLLVGRRAERFTAAELPDDDKPRLLRA